MFRSSRWLAVTTLLLAALFAALPVAAQQYYDPPGRVARISHIQGQAGYSPAGEDVWLDVVRNRPLIRGDRLWTERGSRVEVQVGSTAIRIAPSTSFEFLDIGDRMTQIEVTEGSINLRVRRLHRGETIEVATPSLAFAIERPGRYRIDVDPRDEVTTIVVWEGAGTAYGQEDNFPVLAGDTVRFYGDDLSDYEMFGLPRADEFDRYARDRDLRLDRSVSLRYVDDDLIGYSDLDEYGSWRTISGYGAAWYPTRVSSDWAPYRDGHWVWQDPWGWTWIDDAPWGFAPSHYGRWVHADRWYWVPGPRNVSSVYAPALVAFVGGNNWSLSMSFGDRRPIGWFPLGPRDVYVPSYRASRDYFTRVNVNNTIVNNTTIVNVYNNYASGRQTSLPLNYANRNVMNAVTAVPSDVFVNSRPVRGASMRLDNRALTTGDISRLAPVAPTQRSVHGAARPTNVRPSREALQRQVIARSPPPAQTRPFNERVREMAQTPGRPLEQAQIPGAQGRARAYDRSGNVRVLGEQRGRQNARNAPSEITDAAPASQPARNRPVLDRTIDTSARDRGRGERDVADDARAQPRGNERQPVDDVTTPRGDRPSRGQEMREREVDPSIAEQQRRESERQQQSAERQRQRDQARDEQAQQEAARGREQADRQRETDRVRDDQVQREAAREQQQAERQRQMDQGREEQERREAAREQQRAERQRQVDESRQREVESDQRDQEAAQQAARQAEERQRQVDDARMQQEQRQAEREQQAAQRQQQMDMQRQQREQQEAERQQQNEMQQQRAQEQAERDAERERQAAEREQPQQERQADEPREERGNKDDGDDEDDEEKPNRGRGGGRDRPR